MKTFKQLSELVKRAMHFIKDIGNENPKDIIAELVDELLKREKALVENDIKDE